MCGIFTGLPVPPLPGECQHPLRLDRVCFHFPELKLLMCHGADPWWDVAIRLMIKYRGLHLQTSAWAPKRLPPELIHFMNTRGQDKILCASNKSGITKATGDKQAVDVIGPNFPADRLEVIVAKAIGK